MFSAGKKRTCSVTGCVKRHVAKGLCGAHYKKKLYEEHKSIIIAYKKGELVEKS